MYWLPEALKDLGQKEIPGPKHNPKIIERIDWADGVQDSKQLQGIRDDETAWCASWLCGVLEASGVKSPRSAMARSFARWGQKLDGPAEGCIVVFWRGSRNGSLGHVGLVVGKSRAGHLMVLGGNQDNQVKVSTFGLDRVLAYRWPDGEPLPPKTGFGSLPVVRSDGRLSTNEA